MAFVENATPINVAPKKKRSSIFIGRIKQIFKWLGDTERVSHGRPTNFDPFLFV